MLDLAAPVAVERALLKLASSLSAAAETEDMAAEAADEATLFKVEAGTEEDDDELDNVESFEDEVALQVKLYKGVVLSSALLTPKLGVALASFNMYQYVLICPKRYPHPTSSQ